MARNRSRIKAPAEAVFDVLADPRSYEYWVVGSKKIRAADPDWPKPGSKIHHTVGIGPLTINDNSEVEQSVPPYRLVLRARVRPLGVARVTLRLDRIGDETEVTMIEDPADKRTALLFNPLTHLLVRGRNSESLRRLGELAEQRAAERRRDAGS